MKSQSTRSAHRRRATRAAGASPQRAGVRRQGRRSRGRVDVHDDRSVRRQRHAVAGDGEVVLRRPVRLRQGHEDDPGAGRELRRRARTASSTRSSCKKGIKFHDGTDFKADAVKANLDRVTNPDNKLKRYGLYNNNIAKTEVVDDYTARITLKTPFSPFIAQLAHPSTVMISPAGAQAVGQQGHRVPSGRHRSVQVRRMEGDRLPEGREVRRLLAEGLSEGRHDHLEAGRRQQLARGADADRRGALHVSACRTKLAEVLKAKPDLEVVAAPSIVLRYLSMNTQQKPFDNPEGAPGDRLRDQQGGARQGRVQRLRDAGRRRGAARRRVRGEDRRRGRTTSRRRSSC